MGKTSFIMSSTLVTINVVISLWPMALDLGMLEHLCWASRKEIPKKVSHLQIILTNAQVKLIKNNLILSSGHSEDR
jgi:hypothetical protein